MPKCHCSEGSHCKKCKQCIKVVLPPPVVVTEPFIGMSVFKNTNLEIPTGSTEPVVIGGWSDERVGGIRRFYITPDNSFNTLTGIYTITKTGKYRSAVNIHTENHLITDVPRRESITFAFLLNGVVFQEFSARGNVVKETVSTTLTLQLNEGDQIQLLAYPVNIPGITGSYTINGTPDQNNNPILTSWSLSRFAN